MQHTIKRHVKRTVSDIIFDSVLEVLGLLVLIAVAYPLYFVVLSSFSDPAAVTSGKAWLFTSAPTFGGYQEVFENARIWVGYRNTIAYVLFGTVLHLAVTLPAAFALSRKKLLLRTPITLLMSFTMFFSGGMIPTYLIYKSYGILNTFWVMTIPGCFSVYNMIIARSFFENSISEELFDAARIDGSTDFRFFFSIVLPLSKAIIAVIALYYAVYMWNNYMSALLYITTDSKRPLQLILREILITSQAEESMLSGQEELMQRREQVKYCVIVVSTLPLMTVYPFLQKYFNKGVMVGSVKG